MCAPPPFFFPPTESEPRDAGTDQRSSGIIRLHTIKQIIDRVSNWMLLFPQTNFILFVRIIVLPTIFPHSGNSPKCKITAFIGLNLFLFFLIVGFSQSWCLLVLCTVVYWCSSLIGSRRCNKNNVVSHKAAGTIKF